MQDLQNGRRHSGRRTSKSGSGDVEAGQARASSLACVAPPRLLEAGELDVKNCKLCGLNKVCNDLPGVCILLQYVAIAVVVGALIYLFVTQEVMN